MKHIFRVVAVSFIFAHAASAIANPAPYIAVRSQSVNAARHLVGWNREINKASNGELYFSFNVAAEYTRSFRDERLARCLFGDDVVCNPCGSAINVSGYEIANRGEKDWFAPYFGLPNGFKSTLEISPRVDNFIIDFSLFVGFDNWVEGMYLRFIGPFVHNRRRLNFQETVERAGRTGYPQGWYGPHRVPGDEFSGESSVTRSMLNPDFTAYATGHTPNLPDDIAWNPLCCGKFFNDCERGPMTSNGFGELQMILGWNAVAKENAHFGIGLLAAAPTGSRPDGEYVFEPIIGNGKHWELGVHLSGHWLFWEDEAADRSAGIYGVANITHMFTTRQTRCFDLCGKPNSRYMLAQKLGTLRLDPHVADPEYGPTDQYYDPLMPDAGVEFQNEFAPVANLTCTPVDVKINVQADIAFMFEYQSGGYQFDLGYNFWGRGCEDICPDTKCKNKFECDTWALKGDAYVVGFEGTEAAMNPKTDRRPVRLAATDSKATIHRGTKGNVDQPSNNFADNPVLAFTENIEVPMMGEPYNLIVMSRTDNSPNDVATQARTSNEPIFIQQCDFDLAGTRGISHKIFAHVNYTWIEQECDWTPYLGIGFEAEFGKVESCKKDPCKKECKEVTCKKECCGFQSCHDCAVSQWGVWLKLGLSH